MTTLLASDLSDADLALLARRDEAPPATPLRASVGPAGTRPAALRTKAQPLVRSARSQTAGWVPPGWPGVMHDASCALRASH